jgi:hypothetical protein
MTKFIITVLGIYYASLAAFLVVAPHAFYEMTPGVAETGPFNSHFTVDVGFAFLVAGIGLIAGAIYANQSLAFLGAAFPVLHGVFHVWLWARLGFQTDLIAVSDVLATAGPAAIALFMVTKLRENPA